jgi:hypothetical protein
MTTKIIDDDVNTEQDPNLQISNMQEDMRSLFEGISFEFPPHIEEIIKNITKVSKNAMDAIAKDKDLVRRLVKHSQQQVIDEFLQNNPRPDLDDLEKLTQEVKSTANGWAMEITPAKGFSKFIKEVIRDLRRMKKTEGEIGRIVGLLFELLEHRHETNIDWKKSDQMPTDFFCGYYIGVLSLLAPNAQKWSKSTHILSDINQQLNKKLQAQRAQKKGLAWTSGMEEWLRNKMLHVKKKTTTRGISLVPSNRAFALSVRDEATQYNLETFGHKWTNQEAAFEWIQKMIRKIISS